MNSNHHGKWQLTLKVIAVAATVLQSNTHALTRSFNWCFIWAKVRFVSVCVSPPDSSEHSADGRRNRFHVVPSNSCTCGLLGVFRLVVGLSPCSPHESLTVNVSLMHLYNPSLAAAVSLKTQSISMEIYNRTVVSLSYSERCSIWHGCIGVTVLNSALSLH